MLMTIGMMPMTVLASEPTQNVAKGINYSFSANENVNFNGGTSNLSFEVLNDAILVDGVSNDHVQIGDNTRQVNGSIGLPENAQYTRFTVRFQGGQSIESASITINGTEKLDSSAIEQLAREDKLEFSATENDLVVVSIVLTTNNGQQPGPGGGEGGQPGGQRADARIILNGMDGSWTGVPMVNDYGLEPDVAGTFNYSETWMGTPDDRGERRGGALVNIIDGEKSWTDSWYGDYGRQQEKGYLEFGIDGVQTGQGSRKIIVATQWSEKVDHVVINGVSYDGSLLSDGVSMQTYMEHFGSQIIFNEIIIPSDLVASAVVRGNPADGTHDVEVYKVEVAVRPITRDECKIGNFLWSDDESCKGDDLYVDHATLTMVNFECVGNKWTEAQILAGECPFVGSYQSSSENHERRKYGEMFVPAGATVTMKVTPDPGYQVKSFNLSGSDFVAGTEPGVFTFTIGKGNYHLGASTVKVEDKVEATATSVSDVKATVTAGGDYEGGNANLSIANAEITDDKKADFAAAAGEQEVDLIGGENAYLAIDLEQVIYKANSAEDPNKENETWTQDIHDLGNGYSDVTMKFGNDVDVSTVVLLHNIGDGEDFETIRPISYDATNHTATFRIKSFSTFAIAKAHTKTVPVTPSNTDTNTNTNTNSGSSSSSAPAAAAVDTVPKTAESFPMALLIILSIASLGTMTTVVVKRRRM